MKHLIKFLPAAQPEYHKDGALKVVHHPLFGGKKPFVITQDIKEGDKVDLMKIDGEIDFLKKEFKLPKCDKDGYVDLWNIATVHINNFYKILGEVSPEAMFVEDNKEYEVKEDLTAGWVPSYNDPDNAGLAPSAEPNGIYLIKCPTCNHYH